MPTEQEPVSIWGVPLPISAPTPDEWEYLEDLPKDRPSHSWVCQELDRVWDEFGLDSRGPLNEQPIDAFYRHPVWLMNGLSASDPVSRSHRAAIADHVARLAPETVVDVGGGFGELALMLSDAVPDADIQILEPFPSPVGQARLNGTAVRFRQHLEDDAFDVVIAQDVLEHVEDPVGLAIEIAQSVRPGGTVIFANNFTPVIKCHLPRTFHLRLTFSLIMRVLGLKPRGRVQGARHAASFEIPRTLRVAAARRVERLSRTIGPSVKVALAWRRGFLNAIASEPPGQNA